jgi:hypothetical protein
MRDCVAYVEHGRRNTVTVTDVVFALKRVGRPVYGTFTSAIGRAMTDYHAQDLTTTRPRCAPARWPHLSRSRWDL